ncbi:MAG TPA: hypothetical protein VMD74_00325 [Candidatus Methylomirabilis sp.]|nr:hypothetical protein [Candidatus Methylomirabilis sp.]
MKKISTVIKFFALIAIGAFVLSACSLPAGLSSKTSKVENNGSVSPLESTSTNVVHQTKISTSSSETSSSSNPVEKKNVDNEISSSSVSNSHIELRNISTEVNRTVKEKYSTVKGVNYIYSYPANWYLDDYNGDNPPVINAPIHEAVSVDSSKDYLDNYKQCITEKITDDYFINCPFNPDYKQDTLDKLLSGKYILLQISPNLPPGGEKIYKFSRVIDNKIVTVIFGSGDFFEMPSETQNSKGIDDFVNGIFGIIATLKINNL